MDKIKRIKELVSQLNTYRNAYYNNSESQISDYEYDNLFDELKQLEDETGAIMSNLHPTQKPLLLCEELIKTFSNEGDTVLDNSMGSGTTGVACKNLNRDFIGIELREDYFETAKERIGQ